MEALDDASFRARVKDELAALRGRQVMMFYSGGRDSSVVLHFLEGAAREFGFAFETHAALFPLHVYPPEERARLDRYWRERGVFIRWHEIPAAEDALEQARREGTSPCRVCNATKKSALMRYIRERKVDLDRLTIVMSYSLWDLVSACLEHLLSAKFAAPGNDRAVRYKPVEERFRETFQRFYPLLRLPGGMSVFKPLIFWNDPQIEEVLAREAIAVLQTSCRFKPFRPKRSLSALYERLGLAFDFERVRAFAAEALGLPPAEVFSAMPREDYLRNLL